MKMPSMKQTESGSFEVKDREEVGESRRVIFDWTSDEGKVYAEELRRFLEMSKIQAAGTLRANKSLGFIRLEKTPDRMKDFFQKFKPVGETRSKFEDEDRNIRYLDGIDTLRMTKPTTDYTHGAFVQRLVIRAGEELKPFNGQVCVILVLTWGNGRIQVRFEDMPRGLQPGKVDPKDQTMSTY